MHISDFGKREAWEREARKWGFCESGIRAAADDELAKQVMEVARVSTLWATAPQSCPVPARV